MFFKILFFQFPVGNVVDSTPPRPSCFLSTCTVHMCTGTARLLPLAFFCKQVGTHQHFSPHPFPQTTITLNQPDQTPPTQSNHKTPTSNALQSCRQSSTTFAPFLSPVSWPKSTPTKVATRLLHACRQSILSSH